MLHTCGTSGESSIASHSRVPVVRMLLISHTLEFFTLFHTHLLHDFHINTGYPIVELQANLIRNKANTWLNKFNLTIYISWVKFYNHPKTNSNIHFSFHFKLYYFWPKNCQIRKFCIISYHTCKFEFRTTFN